jgi:hypothetical protein
MTVKIGAGAGFRGGYMGNSDVQKLILERICPKVAQRKSSGLTIYGMKCKGSDDAIGWVAFAQTRDGERSDYWITSSGFYPISQSVTALLFNLNAAGIEAREAAVEPKESWKDGMLAAISEWESELEFDALVSRTDAIAS